MASLKKSVIVAVMFVTALIGAFDGCLLDCHEQPAAASIEASSHCHPASAQIAGLRWQADPTCHHDHTTAAAENPTRSRLDSQPLVAVASSQAAASSPLASIAPTTKRAIADRTGPIAALVPLRV